MNTEQTLFDIVNDNPEFLSVVEAAVKHSFALLGDKVYDLDWTSDRFRHSQREECL